MLSTFNTFAQHRFKHILCIRPDNMGDIIMMTPALRALKETFGCSITLLTSSTGKSITPFIPYIDKTIVANLPWVKNDTPVQPDAFGELTEMLKHNDFDAGIIFTTYSQSSLPSAMLLWLLNIRVRLAYCRENPYHLLTHWLPDQEPYTRIEHEVARQLLLVESIGATTTNKRLEVRYSKEACEQMKHKLAACNIDLSKKTFLFHPGVSEAKRMYPTELWIETGRLLSKEAQIIVSGAANEKDLAATITNGIGANAFCAAGLLSAEEFIALIDTVQLVVSVNTATIHIAAATQTPQVVLYAWTNPQHTPWQAPYKLLTYPVSEQLRSKNEVIRYVQDTHPSPCNHIPTVQEVLNAIHSFQV